MRGAALMTAFACTSLATPSSVAPGAIDAASEAAEANFNIRAQPADQAFGVLGGNFTISALQMHGRNLSQYYHPRQRLRDTFVLGVHTNITF